MVIRNRVKCRKCKDIIESTFTHHFVYCKCKSIAIDGGLDYQRLIGDEDDIDLSYSIYKDQK